MEIFHQIVTDGGRWDVGTDDWVRRCFRSSSYGEGYEEDPLTIRRSRTGKPGFPEIPVFFSVSHSAERRVCLLSSRPVGVDLQKEREVDVQALAERFFTPEEAEYCHRNGSDGFFDIWVRKEAIVKCLGTTLGQGMSRIQTVTDGALRHGFTWEDPPGREQTMEVSLLALDPGWYGAVATMGSEKKEVAKEAGWS